MNTKTLKRPVPAGWVDVIGLGADEFKTPSNRITQPKAKDRTANSRSTKAA